MPRPPVTSTISRTGEADDDALEFIQAGGGQANDIVWIAESDGALLIGTAWRGARSFRLRHRRGIDPVILQEPALAHLRLRRHPPGRCRPVLPLCHPLAPLDRRADADLGRQVLVRRHRPDLRAYRQAGRGRTRLPDRPGPDAVVSAREWRAWRLHAPAKPGGARHAPPSLRRYLRRLHLGGRRKRRGDARPERRRRHLADRQAHHRRVSPNAISRS